MPPWDKHGGPWHHREDGPPLRWIWAWVLVVVVVMVGTWHYRQGADRPYEPILMLLLVFTSAAVAHFTMRFTRRLHRLRNAVEQINLRDLTAHVTMQGHDAVASLAQSFNRMVDRLDSQERARRQFFADLTHEIRHPIAILLGRLESIQDGVVPLDQEQILHLYDTTLGLKRIVTDMNDLSLADVGRLSLHISTIDARAMVEELQDNLGPVAEGMDLHLVSEVHSELPLLQGDADRLRQVMTNLLTNAFHHTPAGGTIVIEAEADSECMIIRVIDTGVGIAPSDLPHLFERFYRADKARSRAKGGSGLGLSIVRSLVELHGGTVQVESKLGQGSRFTLKLPLSIAKEVSSRSV